MEGGESQDGDPGGWMLGRAWYQRFEADLWVWAEKQAPAKDKFRYVMCGTLDDPDALPPKGEFFCKARSKWMPEIPGMCLVFPWVWVLGWLVGWGGVGGEGPGGKWGMCGGLLMLMLMLMVGG